MGIKCLERQVTLSKKIPIVLLSFVCEACQRILFPVGYRISSLLFKGKLSLKILHVHGMAQLAPDWGHRVCRLSVHLSILCIKWPPPNVGLPHEECEEDGMMLMSWFVGRPHWYVCRQYSVCSLSHNTVGLVACQSVQQSWHRAKV